METLRVETPREIVPGSFLFESPAALARDVCREIVRRFEACAPEQHAGRVGHHASVDTSVKRSTDLVMSGKSHWKDLDSALFRSLASGARRADTAPSVLRRPLQGRGLRGAAERMPGEFYHWHIDGGSHDLSHRQLVAIWYLNDVAGPGGETEFRYQAVKVQPEEGKLLLFPPFWTHEHRGCRARARREVHRHHLGRVRLSLPRSGNLPPLSSREFRRCPREYVVLAVIPANAGIQ